MFKFFEVLSSSLIIIGYIHRQEVHDKSSSHETSIGDQSSEEKELDLSNKNSNKSINNSEDICAEPPVSPQRPESSASTVSLSLISNDFSINNS